MNNFFSTVSISSPDMLPTRKRPCLEIINWSWLPDEVLLMIFSYLSFHDRRLTLSLVCQRWARLSLDPIAYTAFFIKGEGLTSNEILQTLRDAPNLKTLEISGRNDTNYFLKEVGRHNTRLLKLKLKNSCGSSNRSNISAAILNYVISKCKLIKALSIEESACRSRKLWNCLPLYLPNLTKISYVGRINLDNRALVRTIRTCQNLESIKIFTYDLALQDKDVKKICKTFKTQLLRFKIISKHLTDQSVDYLINKCTNLVSLHLQQSLLITNAAYQKFSKLSNLHSLSLTCEDMRIWNDVFKPWMKQLRKLNVSRSFNIDDEALTKISEYCVWLEELDVHGCRNITSNGLDSILKCCNRIKILNIYDTPLCTIDALRNNLDLITMKTCRLQELIVCPTETIENPLLSTRLVIDQVSQAIKTLNPYIKIISSIDEPVPVEVQVSVRLI